MIPVALQAIPNQTFTIILESNRYQISVIETAGVMSATISRNDAILIENIRITAGTFLLPYGYLEDGNFIVLNLNDELIYYTNFGSTQNLFYLTVSDLANLRSFQ
jgi:hypothetical protein